MSNTNNQEICDNCHGQGSPESGYPCCRICNGSGIAPTQEKPTAFEDEFAGKSYREALEIIVFDPKDERFSMTQINKLEELHNSEVAKARNQEAINILSSLDTDSDDYDLSELGRELIAKYNNK